MGELLSFAILFEREECCNCGTPFAMTSEMMRKRRTDGENFYCPNGHSQRYTETTVMKLKKELEHEKQRRMWAENSRDCAREGEKAAILGKSALKGVVTKIKKRVAHGVCPCCQRTFINLQRHMGMKHPNYASKEDSA